MHSRRGAQPTGRLGRCAVAAGVAALVAQPAGAAGLRDVVKVKSDGNQASAQSQKRIDAISDQTDEMLAEYRLALKQIDSLRVYNQQLSNLIQAQEAEQASLHGQIENVTVVARQVTPLMMQMLDALAEFIELDVPFLIEERRERVANLREMMSRADVADSEKFRRILEAYQIENDAGRSFDSYQGDLEIGGQTRTVDFLMVGRIALLYQTLDGAEVGAFDAANRKWVQLPAGFRSPVKKALRIARKQEAPDLIELPVASPASSAGESR